MFYLNDKGIIFVTLSHTFPWISHNNYNYTKDICEYRDTGINENSKSVVNCSYSHKTFK
jgi:hypothetical protein